MKSLYTSQELLEYSQCVANIEKYLFYKRYVLELENDYEELYIEYENVFDELQALKEKDKRQRQIITRMKKQQSGAYKKSVFNEDDATRYRKQNIEMMKTIDELRNENRLLKERLKHGKI